MKNRKYYLRDIETDTLHETTKETWEQVQSMLTIKDRKVGVPMIFSTGGNFKEIEDLEKLFYDPVGYKIVKFDNKFEDNGNNTRT